MLTNIRFFRWNFSGLISNKRKNLSVPLCSLSKRFVTHKLHRGFRDLPSGRQAKRQCRQGYTEDYDRILKL